MAKNKSFINEMTVKCIQDAIDDNKFELCGAEPEDMLAIKIDKIKIMCINGIFTMHYDVDVDKAYLDTWMADVGGVVRNDFRHKSFESYNIITTYGTKTLAKRLDENDDAHIILKFGVSKLLKIGDFYFLPIKTVAKDALFVSNSSAFNNFIMEDKEEVIDSDEMDETYEEQTYSKEDMDLMNYYIPDNND